MKTIKLLIAMIAGVSFCIYGGEAHWITSNDNRNEPGSMMCLQRKIHLDSVPSEALVRISADSKYWLWVNGIPVIIEGGVKRGPNPKDSYFDSFNIAPYLASGDNIVSAQVWYFGKEGFSYNPSGKSAFFLECAPIAQLNSGKGWSGRLHPCYYVPEGETPNFRLAESNIGYDARKDIGNWHAAYHYWPDVEEIGAEGDEPWGKLHNRIIPLWKDFGLSDYQSIEIKRGDEADTIVAKLPYNAQVMPFMSIEAPEGEVIHFLTDNYHGGGAPNVRAEYITRSGRQQYENKGWMNGENVVYIMPKGVKIHDLKFRETGYDTEFASNFSCSDPFWKKYYDKAARTLYLTMRDTYMDCPDRERAQWWGDEVNESGEAFYALTRSSDLLMKKGMYELIGWQRPDGSLFSPIPASNWNQELPGQMLASIGHYGFWNYYLNTGDIETISDLYQGAKRYLGTWTKEPDGTMSPRSGGWQWGDWGENIDKTPLYNAWYFLAQKGVMQMADALGLLSERDSIAAEMDELKSAFNNAFWDGDSYRHPAFEGRPDDRVHALAVVAGLADEDKYEAILSVLDNCEQASPYMEKYVAEAYFIMGRGKTGLERMKRRFANMVENPGFSTLFEGWGIGADGFGGGTSNHAWSGGGLTILSQYVAGISPLTPGYERFKVAPNLCGIERIEMTVPTVRGEIEYKAQDKDGELSIEINFPSDMEAELHIPNEYSDISVNGTKRNAPTTLPGGSMWKVKARKHVK